MCKDKGAENRRVKNANQQNNGIQQKNRVGKMDTQM